MKILYGVVGEGMGHAMRSGVILEHLESLGDELHIVVSGRAAQYLAKRHPGKVTEITGLTMAYEDNVVKKRKTALENLKSVVGIPRNLDAYFQLARNFVPDVVITDFESWTYSFARAQGVPLISLDNMQIIARCSHDEKILKGNRKAFYLAKAIVKAKIPKANAYLITTFFYPKIRKNRTSLHPPILRKSILDAKAQVQTGDYVVVYQSGTSHDALVDVLKQFDFPFYVYGMKRDISEDVVDKNVVFRPFSEESFIRDVAGAQAVIAGGGFTLLGEAVYLGKPVFSVPLVGQFEQTLNAAYLDKLGYGERHESITAKNLKRFLDNAERYRKNLRHFEHDQNIGLFKQLKASMAEAIEEGARG